MLENLKKLNKGVAFFSVTDEEFSEYGRVIDSFDATEIIEVAKKMKNPETGSIYIASVPEFEGLAIYKKVKEEIFGTLDTQLGYCFGYSDTLNATEWHHSSELNIAVTDLVLILGKRSDMKNGRLSSSDMKAFFVPAGTVLEAYATTLHFCPCQVSDGGFGCVVGLPSGTKTPLDDQVEDKLLFRKNKWIVAHDENTELQKKGVAAGIGGINYKIKY